MRRLCLATLILLARVAAVNADNRYRHAQCHDPTGFFISLML
jgi:hypothetical protein